jgi:hypothetical protein
MANVNNPHGLRPIMRGLFGGPVSVEEYTKLVGVATAIYSHDTVIAATGGVITPQATAATGTFVGVSLNYGAASTATTHTVVHSPDSLFEAQDDNSTDGLAQADMGKNTNVKITAGNTSTLVSKFELTEASVATTSTLDVQLHRLYNVPDNAFGSNARIEVTLNRHFYANARTGV